MKRTDLPQIQGKRFDIETLHGDIADLTKQANEGPTFLRRNGRVSYVVMSEDLFEKLWPDPRRAWGIEETPIRERKILLAALRRSLEQSEESNKGTGLKT